MIMNAMQISMEIELFLEIIFVRELFASSIGVLDCDNYADRIYVVIAITLVASALITWIPVYRVRCRWTALV